MIKATTGNFTVISAYRTPIGDDAALCAAEFGIANCQETFSACLDQSPALPAQHVVQAWRAASTAALTVRLASPRAHRQIEIGGAQAAFPQRARRVDHVAEP